MLSRVVGAILVFIEVLTPLIESQGTAKITSNIKHGVADKTGCYIVSHLQSLSARKIRNGYLKTSFMSLGRFARSA
jgi:hypothetical protein